jgi:acetyltransferase-like isoleucine patch superfamily enzyme
MRFKIVISMLSILLPWPMRRWVLVQLLGFKIDKTARIGFSWVCPMQLEMGPRSRIGHLTCIRPGMDLLRLEEGAGIGNLNWVSGEPIAGTTHYTHQTDRRSQLIVREQAAITNRHLIDCSATVTIGKFSTVAGSHTIILSHGIDLENNRQRALPVSVGEYCFVGAASVLLAGSALPDCSVLGASALLNKCYTEPNYLYAGNPARPVKQLSPDRKYVTRVVGYVD